MELNSWPSLLTSLRIIISMSVYVAGKDFFHTFWLLRHMPVNIWIWMCVCVYICMCTTFIHRWKWTLCVHAFFSSVAQSCPTLCNPMDCSTPGLPVHRQLQELTQTHVHWVGDAIQPSHPLSSPSPPAFDLSQHQGLFKWVSSSHQIAKVLEFQLQRQSFQWIFRTDFL